MDNWPVVKVDVKGISIQRPDVLIRSD
jgi:hypothetical protein